MHISLIQKLYRYSHSLEGQIIVRAILEKGRWTHSPEQSQAEMAFYVPSKVLGKINE